jgi:branched-subunit amino acid aminotransferase/4-amino-4-deoxychorismate lyase
MSVQGYARYALINGRVRVAAHARVSIFDRGWLYGEGLFETVPIYDRQPFLLTEHLTRLQAGACALGFQATLLDLPWAGWVRRLLEANGLTQGVLRIQATQGPAAAPGPRAHPVGAPTVVLTAAAPRPPPLRSDQTGLTVLLSAVVHPSTAMLPTAIKHCNYLVSLGALNQALSAGADEALMLNQDGRVCEAACSNVLAVMADHLVTPDLTEGPLAGVTRAAVLAIAARLGLPVQERPLTLNELLAAQEVLLTNALTGPVPVQTLRAEAAGTVLRTWPAPGPWTRQLARHYWDQVRRQAGAPWWSVVSGSDPV